MRAAPVAALLAAACGSTTPEIPPPLPLPTASPSSTLAPAGVLPPAAPGRIGLGAPRPEPLSITLIPVQGSDAVLAVHDQPGSPAAYAQRVGSDGALGPVITLARAHVAGAFALRDGELSIATTEADELCVTTLRGAEITARGCSDARPDVLATIGGRILALAAEEPEKDEDETAKKKPKRPPPSKKRKPKREPSAVEKLFASGREREVMATWIAADGSAPATPEKTGIRFVEPMAGMKLIAAGSRRERVDVVFYEKGKDRGKEKRGTLGVAALDEAGLLVDGSRRSFGESKLAAGFLTDRVDPQLVTFADGSILLAQRGPRGKCDVTVSAPFVMPMIPDDDDCAVEPRRIFRLAQEKRKSKGKPPAPAARPAGIERGAIARATGQPAWEAARVVLTATRAFTLGADGVVSWSEGGAPERSKRPLVADRTRVFGGAVARDGSAVAHTSDGLVTVDESGRVTLVARTEPRGVGGADRPDVAATERRLAVDVSGSWIQAAGELRRLTPEVAPPARAIHADTMVAVGGSSSGLFLELEGSTLVVSRLSPGATLTEIARLASPVAAGFDAVERPGGGAIVAGRVRSPDRAWTTFALDAAGKVVALRRGTISDALRGRPQLVAHPGGALVVDEDGRRVAWLDAQGALLAEAAWPPEASAAVCIDGRPMPKLVPSVQPGLFVTSTAASYDGTCASVFGYGADGSFRWVGSTAANIHTRAELGAERSLGTPAPASRTPSASTPPAPALGPRASGRACPGEMVLVAGDLCVDRHESTLLDRNRGRYASPDFPPTAAAASGAFGDWVTRRERQGDIFARALPVPTLPPWQIEPSPALVAVARAGVRPSGYVSGAIAKSACADAGKRLCTLDEWRRACRGEAGLLFPYGAAYVQGTCNVNGPVHSAATLHDNASIGHLDPRLNRVESAGETVLRETGDTPGCASRWGDDAIYDMVGNVDEWVDEKGGAFAGGFYARSTTNGCEALVSNHPEAYFDYSTGVRCCADAR